MALSSWATYMSRGEYTSLRAHLVLLNVACREHTGGSDELWFLRLNMDHAETTHPRLTPLLINPDLSFRVEEVTAFGNTVAVRCNEGPGAMTQFLCTFIISKEGEMENLHVWDWDPNGEVSLQDSSLCAVVLYENDCDRLIASLRISCVTMYPST
jgi:hypothetical protein